MRTAAGTKRNIISDEARLEMTVRTFKPETRRQVLDFIVRIVKAEAQAAGVPREPLIDLHPGDGYDIVINDPALCEHLAGALRKSMGPSGSRRPNPRWSPRTSACSASPPAHPHSIPDRRHQRNRFRGEAKAKGRLLLLPGGHSSNFLPDQEPTIRTGVAAFTLSALELLGKPATSPTVPK